MKSQEIAFTTTLILNTRENKVIWSPGPTADVIVSEDKGRLISLQPEQRYLSVIYAGKDKHSRFYVNKALCDQLIAYINHQSKTLIKQDETEDELLSMAIEDMIGDLTTPSAPATIVPVEIPVAEKVIPVVIPKVEQIEPTVIPETIQHTIVTTEQAVEYKPFFTIDQMRPTKRSFLPFNPKGYLKITSSLMRNQEALGSAMIDALIEDVKNGTDEWTALSKADESVYGLTSVHIYDKSSVKTSRIIRNYLFKDERGELFLRTFDKDPKSDTPGGSMIEPFSHPKLTVLFETIIENIQQKIKDAVSKTVAEKGLTMYKTPITRISDLVSCPEDFVAFDMTGVALYNVNDFTPALKRADRSILEMLLISTRKGEVNWTPLHYQETGGIYGFKGTTRFSLTSFPMKLALLKDNYDQLYIIKYEDATSMPGGKKTMSMPFYDKDLTDRFFDAIVKKIKPINISWSEEVDKKPKKPDIIPFLDVLTDAIKKEDIQVTIEKLPVNTAEMNKRLEVKYGDGRFLEFTYVDNTELRCHLCTGGKNKRILINRFKDVAAMVAIVSAMHV